MRIPRSPFAAPAPTPPTSLPATAIGVVTLVIGLTFVISFLASPGKAHARAPAPALAPHETVIRSEEVSSVFLETSGVRYEVPPPPPPAPAVVLQNVIDERIPSASRDLVVAKGRMNNVTLTFYDCKQHGFCGVMANGRKVHEGAAACSWNLAMGTTFRIEGDPTGRVYTCEDRGMLNNTHVDIFWNDPKDGYSWQGAVGMSGTIEIVASD